MLTGWIFSLHFRRSYYCITNVKIVVFTILIFNIRFLLQNNFNENNNFLCCYIVMYSYFSLQIPCYISETFVICQVFIVYSQQVNDQIKLFAYDYVCNFKRVLLMNINVQITFKQFYFVVDIHNPIFKLYFFWTFKTTVINFILF